MFVSVSVDVLDPDEQEPNDWDILKLGGVGQTTVLLSVTVCNVAPVFDVVGEAYILHITVCPSATDTVNVELSVALAASEKSSPSSPLV